MANNILTAVNWTTILDEVYQYASKTAVLDSGAEVIKAGTNAGEFNVAKLSMQGLGDYSRANGYVKGDVNLTWQTIAHNFDRGRLFTVDAMDDEEALKLIVANLLGEFLRTQVVPELDAFRFATYAGIAKAASTAATYVKTGTIANGTDAVTAIRKMVDTMNDAQVPETDRVLYLTNAVKGFIDDLDTTKSKAVLDGFAVVETVPQARFVTAIKQLDGTSTGETGGGFTTATGFKNINIMAVHKPAIIQTTKHVVPKIIAPDVNQSADGWLIAYRNYGLADHYDNKLAGIQVHHVA